MALQPLSPRQLAGAPTVFATFMGERGTSFKTVDELLAIYRTRSGALRDAEDECDDLRVGRFMHDMAGDRWEDDVVMQIGVFDDTVLLIDGIHRGMAYLACIRQGIGADRLPALHVDC
jgi:hypothetical protein